VSASFQAFEFDSPRLPLARIHPLSKALALFFLSALSARAHPGSLAASALFAVAGIALSGRGIKAFIADGRFLFWMALFIIPARVIDPGRPHWIDAASLPDAALAVLRLALVFAHAEIFYGTTELSRLADLLSLGWRKATRKKEGDPGLYASLAILSLPRVLAQARAVMEAARSRGYRARSARLRSLRSIIAAVVSTVLAEAFRRMDALEARSYSPSRTLHAGRVGMADAAYAALPAAVLAFAAVFGL
jgi:energy-coupling factor transporter transmembrane protein EcfT